MLRTLRVLVAHPGPTRAAPSTQLSGPNHLHLVGAVLAALREGGAGDQEVVRGVDLLLLTVIV